MLTLLLNPIIRNVGIGLVSAVILIVGYSFWAMHQRDKGYQACKADMIVAAQQHQNKVDETVRRIDNQINQTSDPLSQLQKFWSEQ